MKGIACVILVIGLLNFAKEAPELFKSVFSFGGDLLKGLDLNPHGQIKRNLTNAKDTVTAAGNGLKGVGRTLATPFKAGAAIGKGAVGAVTGAKAGGAAGGFLGGARGLIAGGRAGANNRGFRGTATAASRAGGAAGAISNHQRAAYGETQSRYNTMMNSLKDFSKETVDKKKDAIKALEAQYAQDKANYINTQIAQHQQDYIDRAVNNETNSRVASAAAAAGMTEAAFRSDASRMEQLKNQVLNDNTFMTNARNDAAADAAANRANYEAQAEATFKADMEAKKSDLNKEIAEAQGKSIAGHEADVQTMLENFFRDQKDWGDTINATYTDEFNKKMANDKMDSQIASTINSVMSSVTGTNGVYAGAGTNKTISEKDISALMNSINKLNGKSGRTAAEEQTLADQRTVLSQIMNNMDGAAKKTNENITFGTKLNETYNPKPASDSSSSGGNK